MARRGRRTGNSGSLVVTLLVYGVLIWIAWELLLVAYPILIGLAVVGATTYFLFKRHKKNKRKEEFQRLYELFGYNKNAVELKDVLNSVLVFEKQLLDADEKKAKRSLVQDYREKLSSSGTGYVYFVKDKKNGQVRIGKASDPHERILKGFGVKSPWELEVLYLIRTNNEHETETMFHRIFKSKQMTGKWFRLNSEDINWIKGGVYTVEIYRTIMRR